MININVFSNEKAWSKRLKKKELFFSRICKSFPKKYPIGEQFPSVRGQSREKIKYSIPEDFVGKNVLFLIGFVQNSKNTNFLNFRI